MYSNRKQWTRIRERLKTEGATIRGLSRELGISRVTLRKIADLASPPPFNRTGKRASTLERYHSRIEQILEDSIANPIGPAPTASSIYRHLRDVEGFGGGYTTVREYVRRLAFERPAIRRLIDRLPPERPPSHGPSVVPSRGRPKLRDLRRAEEWEWLRTLVQKDGAGRDTMHLLGEHEDTRLILDHLYDGLRWCQFSGQAAKLLPT